MNYGKGTDGTVFHSEMGANCGIHRPAGGSAVSDSDSGSLPTAVAALCGCMFGLTFGIAAVGLYHVLALQL